jgi:predicted cupin superfamily sugar epimerase
MLWLKGRPSVPARDLIDRLQLAPHPEGGWYREIQRSSVRVDTSRGPRQAITTIYYLLERGQRSRWHVVAADEIWHFYAGAPLELFAYRPDSATLERTLLTRPDAGGSPVGIIAAGVWQAARTLGDYSLVGCCVGPGFEFEDFRLAATLADHAQHFAGALRGLTELL